MVLVTGMLELNLLKVPSVNRKIWTAIDTDQYGDAGYTGGGGWNNWNTNNAAAIQNYLKQLVTQ